MMTLVWLVVVGICIHTSYLSISVGLARGKYGVDAPATSGDEMFERHYRAHMNSIEQHVIFFPLLAACTFTGTPTVAAGLGAVYLLSRIVYAVKYVKDPASRGVGMMPGFLAMVALVLTTLFNLITQL